VVEDGATLNVRESYIRDGIHAIQVEEGGTVNITENIFDANHVSFYTPPKGGPGRYSINMGPFYGNEFINDNDLHPYPEGYSGFQTDMPFAAVFVNDVNNFMASGMGVGGNILPNTINDIPLGIYGFNSSIHIKNYAIDNAFVNPSGQYGGIGILLEQSSAYVSTIEGYGIGSGEINIQNAEIAGIKLENGFNQVRNNVIVDCPSGISLNQSSLSIHVVKENEISASEYGVVHNNVAGGFVNVLGNEIVMNRDNEPANGVTNSGIAMLGHGYSSGGGRLIEGNSVELLDYSQNGIYVNCVTIPRIRENTIHDVADNNPFLGIGSINSPFGLIDYNSVAMEIGATHISTAILQEHSHSSRINCNSTVQSRLGIQVIGGNEGSELKGNNIGIHQDFGMLYGHPGHNIQDEPHVTGIQRHHGNIWDAYYDSAPPGVLGAKHMNEQDIVNRSEYFIDEGDNPLYSTTHDPSGWFEDEMFGNTWGCPEVRPEDPWYDHSTLQEPTEWDEFLVEDFDLLEENPFYVSITSISERNLYERIQMDYYLPSALNHVVLDSFMQSMENSNIPLLYAVRQTMASAVDLSEDDWMEVEGYTYSIDSTVKAVFALDSLAWIDTTSVDTSQWMIDRDQLVGTLSSLHDELDAYLDARDPNIEGAIYEVEAALNGFIPVSAPEAYEAQMLELIANTIYRGNWDFTSSEQNSIEEVADLCPVFGGPAVFWARNMRMSYDPAVMYNDTLCTETWGERLAGEEIEPRETTVRLYPNPTSSEIAVDLSDMDFDQWMIYSIDGKLVSEGRINQDQVLNISTIGMNSGQYMLKLSGKDPTRIVSFIVQNPNR
jgi:hypothetical protein